MTFVRGVGTRVLNVSELKRVALLLAIQITDISLEADHEVVLSGCGLSLGVSGGCDSFVFAVLEVFGSGPSLLGAALS